jgi:hypothetical protein
MYIGDKLTDPCEITFWQRVEISLATLGIGSMNYELACRKVGDDLNYNIGFPCAVFGVYSATVDPENVFNRGCYRLGEIRCVMNAYIHLVESGAIPEYKRENSVLQKIRDEVSRVTGKNVGRVAAIIDAFHYATIDGRVSNNFYIEPLTYRKTANLRKTPASVEEVSNSFSILDMFKWTAYTIMGATAVVVAYNLYDKTAD